MGGPHTSNLTLCFIRRITGILRQVSAYVKANYEHCNGMVNCLNQLHEQSKVAALVPRKFAKHYETTARFPIFCFAESESFNRITRTLTFIRSNSYLLNQTNSLIRQTLETGHLLKWEVIPGAHKRHAADLKGPVVLTIEHVGGVILVYVVGMTAAILTFIGERMTSRKMMNGNNRNTRGWRFLDKYIFSAERLALFVKD